MYVEKKSLLKNSSFFVAYKLFNALFPLITSAYIARVLLPEGVGRIAIAQNAVTYFTYVAALGMPTYGMREIARSRDTERKNTVFSELFIVNLVSSIVCSIGYCFFVMFVLNATVDKTIYMIFGTLVLFNIINVDWVYQGLEEYQYISVRSFLIKLISFGLTLGFVKDRSDINIYAIILSFATVGNYIFNVIHLVRKRYVSLNFRKINIKQHLRPLFVLFASSIAIELYTLVDTTMLGVFCSEQIVGYYTNSMKIVKTIIICFTAISTVAAPKISNYYGKGDLGGIKNLVNKMLFILLMITLPAAIGLFAISSLLIPLFFGSTFIPAIVTMKILSVLLIPITLSTFLGSHILCVINQEKKMLMATVCGAITNIVLNVILIRLYQQNGAAIASVISEVVVAIIDFYCVFKIIKIDVKPADVISLLFSTAVMGGCLLIIMQMTSLIGIIKLVVSVIIGIVVYTMMLVVTKNSFALTIIRNSVRKVKN